MFLESSRYAKQKTVTVQNPDGTVVQAVTLRRLPYVAGTPFVVKENDRLDIIALNRYKDSAMFWHIADANTELEANDLLNETARTINVPET
ncbi:MAG: hypothetical protein JST22_09805 [Bacteroidetes bacterium]|nr:hypothetical protein [Bacteroidota bacterium]